MKKITMQQAIFYQLYQNRKVDPDKYSPVFTFMGEVFCEPLQKWGFVSHEVSARMSEIYHQNPGLLERSTIHGKSGAVYYGYRIAKAVKPEYIRDMRLSEFYKKIRYDN